jgi:hypothetical protein
MVRTTLIMTGSITDDAFDHIDAVEGDPQEGGQRGWWITDRAAERTGLLTEFSIAGDAATVAIPST